MSRTTIARMEAMVPGGKVTVIVNMHTPEAGLPFYTIHIDGGLLSDGSPQVEMANPFVAIQHAANEVMYAVQAGGVVP